MQVATEETRVRQRQQAIAETVARVREIEARQGVNPDALEAIKQALMKLAARTELFPIESGRPEMVVTFLALLELTRERLVDLTQTEPFAPIHACLAHADQ